MIMACSCIVAVGAGGKAAERRGKKKKKIQNLAFCLHAMMRWCRWGSVSSLFAYGYCKKGEGSWQDHVAVSAEHVVHLPDDIDDGVGAQLVINPTTVWGILKELAVPQGQFSHALLQPLPHATPPLPIFPTCEGSALCMYVHRCLELA